MNVVSKPTVISYIDKYPVAYTALLVWHKAILGASFKNFNELKEVYSNASIISNNRVIFNIKGNVFRLLVSFDFRRQSCYIIWFGTHKEYDKIDAATMPYTSL